MDLGTTVGQEFRLGERLIGVKFDPVLVSLG